MTADSDPAQQRGGGVQASTTAQTLTAGDTVCTVSSGGTITLAWAGFAPYAG